jgi:hypothetical protein
MCQQFSLPCNCLASLIYRRNHGRPQNRPARTESSSQFPVRNRESSFGNSQRASYNNWRRMCTPMLGDPRTRQCRSARTIAGYIHRPTAPLLRAQPARIAAPACSTRARTISAISGTPNRNERTRTAAPWLHTTHRRQCARVSQLFRRF